MMMGQEIEVSHSNCIVYMTGVFNEKDERVYMALDDTIFNVPLGDWFSWAFSIP